MPLRSVWTIILGLVFCLLGLLACSSIPQEADLEEVAACQSLATSSDEQLTENLSIDLATSYRLPPGAPHANVKDFGARGDGVTDDTAAIKQALASTFNAWEQVYFPAGTYLISDEISWGRFLTLRGDGPGKTILKLKDKAAGYGDPNKPRAVLFARLNGRDPANDNSSHSNTILNMTIDVGRDNPGAVGIDYASHNGGSIENVFIWAACNSGKVGISMERDSPGPALISRVRVRGFDYGMAVRYGLYGMTFEHITLTNQRLAGFLSDSHPATIRKLISINSVPAIKVIGTRDFGLLVLLDSTLRGSSSNRYAIESEGELFVRNLQTSGYKGALQDGSRTVNVPNVTQYSSSPLLVPFGSNAPVFSLNLPIQDPPSVPYDSDFSNWANVADYASLKQGEDWAPAIQAAIDSGKSTVYFPNFTNAPYPTFQDVIVRGNVRRIVGLWARLERSNAKVIFDNTQPLVVEQLRVDGGFVHRGSGPVLLKGSLGGPIQKLSGSGDLFIQDWCCAALDIQGGNVWARQLNVEDTRSPKILNNRGTFVLLGLKTEQPSQVLRGQNGSLTEILGGVLYPVQGTPTEAMYQSDASSKLAVFHREVGPAYPNFLLRNGQIINPAFTRGVRFVDK